MMKVKSVELDELLGKHYSTEVHVEVEVNGSYYNFLVEVSGYAPNPSRRELNKGWEPDYGMDHVESDVHLFLAETIVKALEKL